MNLLKWLTHPVYLLLIIIAAAIYLNRDILLGAEATAARAADPRLEPAAVATRFDAVGRTDTAPERPADLPSATGLPPGETSAVEAMSEQVAGSLPPPQAQASVQANEPAAAMPAPADAEAEWRQARLLAWQGDWDGAVDAYRRLAQLQPDNIDAHGELGNVLMRAGRWEAAADAYAGAARAAARADNEELAWYLHSITAGLDYEKAAVLRRELTATRDSSSSGANGG